jgi:hypothetical protein
VALQAVIAITEIPQEQQIGQCSNRRGMANLAFDRGSSVGIGMVQRRRCPRFPPETFQRLWVFR